MGTALLCFTAVSVVISSFPSTQIEIAHLSRTTFYYHIKKTHRADKYADAKAEIAVIYHEYSYQRITMSLRSRGILLNHKAVQRLMKQIGFGLSCKS